jgi:putative membrane protein
MLSSFSTLPAFIAYLSLGLLLLALFVACYTWFTPLRELALIRAGNTAAATSLGGAVFGFALPLASAIAHSVSLVDLAVWGVIALVVQLLTFALLRLGMRDLPRQIEAGQLSVAMFAAIVSVAVGAINAAAMSY